MTTDQYFVYPIRNIVFTFFYFIIFRSVWDSLVYDFISNNLMRISKVYGLNWYRNLVDITNFLPSKVLICGTIKIIYYTIEYN